MAVFDMDSTLIDMECIDEIARVAGCGDQVAAITEKAMLGELDFAQSLRERVAALKGVKLAMLDAIRDELPIMPGAAELLKVLRENRWRLVLVSGGFTWFADEVARRFNFDVVVSNFLEFEGDQLTGKVGGRIVDGQVKADTLINLTQQYGLPRSQTMAVGDGANDKLMLQASGFGVAFNAKPVLREVADYCIDEKDLSQLLHVLR
ncbi:phosphoserine phosphatase SerB [Aliidiomarina minuta]|uniref:Phosphoserine phosphatase n=1 Tax=Aliidiomarina minuta TaxID=880057 RepID=A0A432W851_9GAMM|nr:phosphoserine phosphatase SerB [Aliidiomarina minuta]